MIDFSTSLLSDKLKKRLMVNMINILFLMNGMLIFDLFLLLDGEK